MTSMEKIFYEIDNAESEDDLKLLEEQMKDATWTKLFWELRKVAVTKENEPEDREKARLKCRAIAREYNATIPVKKAIQRFSAPYGFTGIQISAYAKVGKGCTILPNVVIGSNTFVDSEGQGFPTIGENVFIGAGAMIIGNVYVGDNVRIGANTVVTKDIPDNTTVVSPEMKVIERDAPLDTRFVLDSRYRKQLVEE